MRKPKFVGVKFILFAIVAMTITGFVVSALWNWLMPALFHLPSIGFWQALGLFLLSNILFGGLCRGGRGFRRARFVRGLKDLTPEERERFRQAMESGRWKDPAWEERERFKDPGKKSD